MRWGKLFDLEVTVTESQIPTDPKPITGDAMNARAKGIPVLVALLLFWGFLDLIVFLSNELCPKALS